MISKGTYSRGLISEAHSFQSPTYFFLFEGDVLRYSIVCDGERNRIYADDYSVNNIVGARYRRLNLTQESIETVFELIDGFNG